MTQREKTRELERGKLFEQADNRPTDEQKLRLRVFLLSGLLVLLVTKVYKEIPLY